jgi:hypothetical protein
MMKLKNSIKYMFDNPDTEPDYNAKTSQELSDEQREIYRTLK